MPTNERCHVCGHLRYYCTLEKDGTLVCNTCRAACHAAEAQAKRSVDNDHTARA
jgi:transcription elongation factor Elf1